MLDARKAFGEYVGRHTGGRNEGDVDKSLFDGLTDKVILKADVFRPCMELGVLGQCDGALIVAGNGKRGQWKAQLREERTKPHSLLGSLRESHVLCLRAGSRNRDLSLGRP